MAMPSDDLAVAMVKLEHDKVLSMVKERLEEGVSPLEIVKNLQEAMTEVGRLFETGEYYLSELVLSGETMKEVMEILEPRLAGEEREYKGNVVIGTVKGDIHDLGKNIVTMLLKGAGYNVIDLGVDVPAERFVEAAKENNASLVGISVLLTACQNALKEAVSAVKEADPQTKVIIGGNYVDEKVREFSGADYFGKSASDAVKVAGEVFS